MANRVVVRLLFMKIISGQIRSYTGKIQLNKVELNRLKYSALQKFFTLCGANSIFIQ